MNRLEHLLTIAAEECAEIAQRASKALRFGLLETEPGQKLNNAERLRLEVVDLLVVLDMVGEETNCDVSSNSARERNAKRERVEHFLTYSDSQGRLNS